MRSKQKNLKARAQAVVKDIRRKTRKQYSTEEDIRIMLEGQCGEDSIAELADWPKDRKTHHVRGAPFLPMTQCKIERWHQTLKNRFLLENYYLPGDPNARSKRSLNITTTCAIMRTSTTRRLLMLTSEEHKPSSNEEKGQTKKP